MEKELNTSKYYSNWKTLYVVGFAGLALLAIGAYERGVDRAWFEGVAIMFLLLALLYYTKINTYLEIQKNRTLIINGQKSVGKQQADLFQLKSIRRVPAFILKNWGSLIVLYFQDDDKKFNQITIREANFDEESIKSFIEKLYRINPNIDLSHEYQKLIEGEIPLGEFKSKPAIKTMYEVERELGIAE